MTKLNKQGKQAAIIAAVLIALAVTCRMLGNNGFYPKTLGLVRSGIYIFLIVAWGVLIDRRIIQTQIRRYMIGISGVMVFWFLLRTWKHHLIPAEALPDVTRYIWYAYYIPMLMLPVLALFASVSLGKPEQYRTPLPLRLLWIPTVLLTLTVLTNDLHQTVFSFPAENTPWTDNRYSYGGMYWIVFAWFVINTLLALGMILYNCRIPRSRTFLWLPVIPFALMIVYGLLYITAHSVIAPFAGDMTSVYCVLIVLIFESCIGCGLIQSNSRYAELFKAKQRFKSVSLYSGQKRGDLRVIKGLDLFALYPRQDAGIGRVIPQIADQHRLLKRFVESTMDILYRFRGKALRILLGRLSHRVVKGLYHRCAQCLQPHRSQRRQNVQPDIGFIDVCRSGLHAAQVGL